LSLNRTVQRPFRGLIRRCGEQAGEKGREEQGQLQIEGIGVGGERTDVMYNHDEGEGDGINEGENEEICPR